MSQTDNWRETLKKELEHSSQSLVEFEAETKARRDELAAAKVVADFFCSQTSS